MIPLIGNYANAFSVGILYSCYQRRHRFITYRIHGFYFDITPDTTYTTNKCVIFLYN